MTQLKSGIAPSCVEEMLDSADNAAVVGQAQFETPQDLALALAPPLPAHRPVLCDLTGGHGNLISGLLDATTQHGLLSEIQPMQSLKAPARKTHPFEWHRVTADLTKLYGLLVETEWFCDLFALNPPFNLHWPKQRLAALAESGCRAVADAFEQPDPAAGKGNLDSTIATLMIALDRMTERGEGVLIANNDTLKRLIFAEDAPHSALAQHVWLHAVLDGNPMTKSKQGAWGKDFETGILYFARSHFGDRQTALSARTVDRLAAHLQTVDRGNRYGSAVLSESTACRDTVRIWDAVKTEWQQRAKPVRTDYNLWLEGDAIRVQLTRFDECSLRVNKQDAQALYEMAGQSPLNLVMQTATRNALVRAARGELWRVHPDLPAAIQQAIADYNSVRAPLYPLPSTQRLGFLDENDTILCTKDL